MASGSAIDTIEMASVMSSSGGDSRHAAAVASGSRDLHKLPTTSFVDDDRDKASEDRATSIDANGEGVVRSRDAANIGTYKYDGDRKIGHRRIGESGQVTYKKIETTQLMGSIQLGIQHSVGSLASKPKRDLLMLDFFELEAISFPPEGSSQAPAHHFSEFKFKIYAPTAFRFFRHLFGIQPDDFLMSMCYEPLRELSNPGASGSIFYLTGDDEFIIKTVQHKEGEFLQKLLPGYYLNLSQNPRTLLPKFFGLYCFQCNSKNIRLIVMNNLLPSYVKMHLKYDLKGSTYNRKASKSECLKESPTFKDLDFMEQHPNGILLEAETYNALVKTIQRDCRVLESFKIMDYSLLVGVHNLDRVLQEKKAQRENPQPPPPAADAGADDVSDLEDAPEADQNIAHEREERERGATALNRSRSINRQRLVAHSTAMESIQAESEPIDEEEDVPPGGIPARSHKGERLLLFIGIIDILQSYRLKKRLEHTFKSIIHDGDTVSVCRPSFYSQRFQNFMAKTVFKKIPSLDLPEVKGNHRKFRTLVSSYIALKHSPSKRKSLSKTAQQRSQDADSDAHPVAGTSAALHQNHARSMPAAGVASGATGSYTYGGPSTSKAGTAPSCSSTPPPPFDDISEGSNSIHRHQTLTQQYPTMPRRGLAYREDTVRRSTVSVTKQYTYRSSISEIRLDPHLAIDTSVGSHYGSGNVLSSWTPPASVEGSTPTFTEGTPSFTESSSSGEMAFSGNSSPLNTSASDRHKPTVEEALNSLTSEMPSIEQNPPSSQNNNINNTTTTPTANTAPPSPRFRFISKIMFWQPAN